MRFLADENIPRASVTNLQQSGYDLQWIADFSPGISDEQILLIAQEQDRIIITFDRDFGELLFKKKITFRIGIIYLKFVPSSILEPAIILNSIIQTGKYVFENYFTVIERDLIRQRLL